ncbi:hypothetical protein HYP67_gp093 [Acinetobacter phage vB_ApiM_fHyAci03]|uniref:Uncharacterized protein n=1 Tax=Acinetobacter phage vB_ApiM_fHyAci03 TaxID=2269366 RepID=A0A345AUS9_9CAUD|nr:hypothetical protein HYP67_gp093 [Acinetobacter phage vB_ApiM_fHyAci03]AXF40662.1 hypothetical protein Ac3_093 [Acinetobacter phage vB_ApiM_fHyAci03]UNI74528.1 hypothetical protein ABNavy4_090 [Acinetobacter phage AB-Navy4]
MSLKQYYESIRDIAKQYPCRIVMSDTHCRQLPIDNINHNTLIMIKTVNAQCEQDTSGMTRTELMQYKSRRIQELL